MGWELGNFEVEVEKQAKLRVVGLGSVIKLALWAVLQASSPPWIYKTSSRQLAGVLDDPGCLSTIHTPPFYTFPGHSSPLSLTPFPTSLQPISPQKVAGNWLAWCMVLAAGAFQMGQFPSTLTSSPSSLSTPFTHVRTYQSSLLGTGWHGG